MQYLRVIAERTIPNASERLHNFPLFPRSLVNLQKGVNSVMQVSGSPRKSAVTKPSPVTFEMIDCRFSKGSLPNNSRIPTSVSKFPLFCSSLLENKSFSLCSPFYSNFIKYCKKMMWHSAVIYVIECLVFVVFYRIAVKPSKGLPQ